MDGKSLVNAIDHLDPEFVFVSGAFVPSKNLNYKLDGDTKEIARFWFRKSVLEYERMLRQDLVEEVAGMTLFPTAQEVHLAITFGIPPDQYHTGDIDNKAKTIVDALKGPIYLDDLQVKILWVDKQLTQKEENWCVIAVKLLA